MRFKCIKDYETFGKTRFVKGMIYHGTIDRTQTQARVTLVDEEGVEVFFSEESSFGKYFEAKFSSFDVTLKRILEHEKKRLQGRLNEVDEHLQQLESLRSEVSKRLEQLESNK